MTTSADRAGEVRGWCYHLSVLGVGLVVVAFAVAAVVSGTQADCQFGLAMLLGVPLIAVVARFPMVSRRASTRWSGEAATSGRCACSLLSPWRLRRTSSPTMCSPRSRR